MSENTEEKQVLRHDEESGPSDHPHPHASLNSQQEADASKGGRLSAATKNKTIAIRSHSGLSGDIIFCGLAVLRLLELGLRPDSEEARLWLNDLCSRITPELADCVQLGRAERSGVYGWVLNLRLNHCHEHRNLAAISKIKDKSKLSSEARELGMAAFGLLAECEAQIHNKRIEDVHFHEIGALDSILDIVGVCELYCLLGQPAISCSPLPVSDGSVICAHGAMPAPAPASLKLLEGFPVRPFEGALDSGELLTPTALALLHVLNVSFGPWPSCVVQETAIVYGQRSFPNAPNGAVFVLGEIQNPCSQIL